MRQSVGEIREKQPERIASVFQVVGKTRRSTRKGDPFVSLTLADATGQIDAAIWYNVENASAEFEVGNAVEIAGVTAIYRNAIQITIRRIRRRGLSAIELQDRPHLDSEMLMVESSKDCDGAWVGTDESAAMGIATDRTLNAIVAKYSAPHTELEQKEKPDLPKLHMKVDPRVEEIIRKYSTSKPEKF